MNATTHKTILKLLAAVCVLMAASHRSVAQTTPDLPHFAPPDSQIVTVFDIKRLRDSRGLGPLVRNYFDSEDVQLDARRTAFFIGSDIRTDWEAIMWASTGGAKPTGVTVVQGKFDHKRLVEFIHLADGVTTERYLNIVLHKVPDAETKKITVVAFLAENLLAMGDESAVRRAIEARWEKIPADEKKSGTLAGFSKLPANSFVRIAIADPLTTPEETAQGKSQVKNMFLAMSAADNAEMMVQADAVNVETAGQLKTTLEALFALSKLSAAGDKMFSAEMMKALNDAKFELQESSVIFKMRVPKGAVGEMLNLPQLPRLP